MCDITDIVICQDSSSTNAEIYTRSEKQTADKGASKKNCFKVSLRLIDISIDEITNTSRNCEVSNHVVFLENGTYTVFQFDNDALFGRIQNQIRKANIKHVYGEKDECEIEPLLKAYNDRRKLVFVKLDDILYVVSDKNNYRILSSLIKTVLKSCTVISRTCESLSRDNTQIKSISPSTIVLERVCPLTQNCTIRGDCARSRHCDKASTKLKVLSPTKVKGPTCVPPDPSQTPKARDHALEHESFANPLHGEESRYPVQATDGACSMLSMDNFASNVGSRYKPTTSKVAFMSYGLSKRPPKPKARYPDKENYDVRWNTFLESDWEKHPERPEVYALLEWGFFYTGQVDLVRCYVCGIGLKDWSPEDVVRDEHVRYSGECELLKDKLGLEELDRLKRHLSVKTDSAIASGISTAPQNQAGSAFRSMGTPYTGNQQPVVTTSRSSTGFPTQTQDSRPTGANKNANPKLPYSVRHPTLQSVEARLKTFEKFPRTVPQDPRKLAIAGFFYTGTNDICRCFCCDGGMTNWDVTDEPIREHAKYFESCSYIRQIKGEEYIRSVQINGKTGKTERRQAETSQLTARESSQTVRLAMEENHERRVPITSEPNGLHRSKIVKNVLELGFDKTKVQIAVDTLIKKGRTEFTEDDIVNVMFDEPQTTEQLGSTGSATDPDEILEENERLKSVVKCLNCKIEEANVLFLPCAHHKMCVKCADALEKCSVCSKRITKKIRTFMS